MTKPKTGAATAPPLVAVELLGPCRVAGERRMEGDIVHVAADVADDLCERLKRPGRPGGPLGRKASGGA